MNNVRYFMLERGGQKLTPEERAEGWHFCHDWDGMLVGPGMPEMECCTCAPSPSKEPS